jgi:hypothetical protein
MIPGDREYNFFCFPCILFSPIKVVKKVCLVSFLMNYKFKESVVLSFLGVLAAAVCVCVCV